MDIDGTKPKGVSVFYLHDTPIDFVVFKNSNVTVPTELREIYDKYPIHWFLACDQWVCMRKSTVSISSPHVPIYLTGKRCLHWNRVNLCTLVNITEDKGLELIIGLWLRLKPQTTLEGFGKLRTSLWHYIRSNLSVTKCTELLAHYTSHKVLSFEIFKFFEAYNTRISPIDLQKGLTAEYVALYHDTKNGMFFSAIDYALRNEFAIVQIKDLIRIVLFSKRSISFYMYNKTLFCKNYPCLTESLSEEFYEFYSKHVFIPTMALYSTPHNFLSTVVT